VFSFHGEDYGGPFAGDAVAVHAAAGFYVSAQTSIRASRRQVADVYINSVEDHGDHCVVEGSWAQDGYEGSPWSISAPSSSSAECCVHTAEV